MKRRISWFRVVLAALFPIALVLPPTQAVSAVVIGNQPPPRSTLLHEVQRRGGGFGGGFQSYPSAPRQMTPPPRLFTPPSRSFSTPRPPTQHQAVVPQTRQPAVAPQSRQTPRFGPVSPAGVASRTLRPNDPRAAPTRSLVARSLSRQALTAARAGRERQAMALTRRVGQVDQRIASSLRPQVASALSRSGAALQARRTAIASRLGGPAIAASAGQPGAARALRERTNAACALAEGFGSTEGTAPGDQETGMFIGSYQVAALGPSVTSDVLLDPTPRRARTASRVEIAAAGCARLKDYFVQALKPYASLSRIFAADAINRKEIEIQHGARRAMLELIRVGYNFSSIRSDQYSTLGATKTWVTDRTAVGILLGRQVLANSRGEGPRTITITPQHARRIEDSLGLAGGELSGGFNVRMIRELANPRRPTADDAGSRRADGRWNPRGADPYFRSLGGTPGGHPESVVDPVRRDDRNVVIVVRVVVAR